MALARTYFWLAFIAVLSIGFVGASAEPQATPVQKAEAALAEAAKAEEQAELEWNSLEMARSATREIARAERTKTAAAIQAAKAALPAS